MKALIVFLVLCGATEARSQTVLLMAGDTDSVTRSFVSSSSCGGLRGLSFSFGNKEDFDYSLSVARDEHGKFQVLLLDHRTAGHTSYVFLGTDYRKGTERACDIIKKRRAAVWSNL